MAEHTRSVLIIEDEPSLRNILIEKFTAENFDVYTAKDGEQGLQQALAYKPDVILLDLLMPRMDGEAMLRSLRKDEWGKGAYVVILTNVSKEDDMLPAFSEEVVTDYLLKADWSISDVVARVRERMAADAQ